MSSARFLTPANVGDTNWHFAGSADFNGDGKEDILFQHTDGTLAVWSMNGVIETFASLVNPSNPGDRNWRIVATSDLDRDGKVDLMFQHSDGTLATWFMNGVRLKSAALFNPSTPGDRNWKVVGIGDFDANGKLDLLFQHTDGTLAGPIHLAQGGRFHTGGLQQRFLEDWRAGFGKTECSRKNSRFVFAARVVRIQAILDQFVIVDDRIFSVRKIHEGLFP